MGFLALHSCAPTNPSPPESQGGCAHPRLPSYLENSLVDPRFDFDSCGVGFVAQLSGDPSHEILERALTALARLEHRGAVAADGKSSDGVGVMTAIPRDLFLLPLGIELSHDQPLGVAVVFLDGGSLASR